MKIERYDMIVIGAGPAGLSAAIEAAKKGLKPIVFDENAKPGGQLFKQIHKFFGSKEHKAKVRGFKIGQELLAEADDAARLIRSLTGGTPRFFRSGTNHYEEAAVAVLRKHGYAAAGYSVLGDAGGTWSRRRVKEALLAARPGDIVLLHANRPARGTAEGVIDAVPEMLARGVRFVSLSDAVAPPSE